MDQDLLKTVLWMNKSGKFSNKMSLLMYLIALLIHIAEGVLAIQTQTKAKELALSIHPHPTLSETMMETAEVFYGTATHIYKKKRS